VPSALVPSSLSPQQPLSVRRRFCRFVVPISSLCPLLSCLPVDAIPSSSCVGPCLPSLSLLSLWYIVQWWVPGRCRVVVLVAVIVVELRSENLVSRRGMSVPMVRRTGLSCHSKWVKCKCANHAFVELDQLQGVIELVQPKRLVACEVCL
jgi:hypothetical protein